MFVYTNMLTKPIPQKLRDEMSADPYYERCCVTGVKRGPGVKIEWHHNFSSYANGNKGRVNEKWCILPVHEKIHAKADTREVREILDRIMLNRADDATLKRWSKSENLIEKRDRLNRNHENKKDKFVLRSDLA